MMEENPTHPRASLQDRLERLEQQARELANVTPFFSDPQKRADCRAMVDSLRQKAESLRKEIALMENGAG
jgi:flagellar biosynthesis/type III secretory pathway chaperone